MKKSIMLGAMMMMSVIIFAQNHHEKDPKEHAAKVSEKMKTVLSLSDEQFASIKNINEKYAGKKIEFRKNKEDDKGDRKSVV